MSRDTRLEIPSTAPWWARLVVVILSEEKYLCRLGALMALAALLGAEVPAGRFAYAVAGAVAGATVPVDSLSPSPSPEVTP